MEGVWWHPHIKHWPTNEILASVLARDESAYGVQSPFTLHISEMCREEHYSDDIVSYCFIFKQCFSEKKKDRIKRKMVRSALLSFALKHSGSLSKCVQHTVQDTIGPDILNTNSNGRGIILNKIWLKSFSGFKFLIVWTFLTLCAGVMSIQVCFVTVLVVTLHYVYLLGIKLIFSQFSICVVFNQMIK